MPTGQPGHFQCSACARRKPWHPDADEDGLYGKGGFTRVELTGKLKPVPLGRGGSCVSFTRYQYRCLDCDHVGWSRHLKLLEQARLQGLEDYEPESRIYRPGLPPSNGSRRLNDRNRRR